LAAEHVSDDDFVQALQGKVERPVSPTKKIERVASPKRKETSLSYPEPIQMQNLNWKDKKVIIEGLI
jgi:hypothetical protein